MSKSRRDFLRSLGIGAAAGAVVHWPLSGVSTAETNEPGRSSQPNGFILLNSNENPYGPSPKVASAVRSATGRVNRYAFMQYDDVTKQIADFHNVKPEQVLFGCGSTELLRVAACAYLGPDRKLIQAVPTFKAIAHSAKAVGAEVVSVRLTRGFAHDLDGMLAQADHSAGLVYICNPNNPTSSLTPRKTIESFIEKLPPTTHVIVDEAYHDFVVRTPDYASFIDSPLNDERVIVTRTFSKVYGLAGLRLGYAVASPKAVEKMRPFLTEDGLNAIAGAVVNVALNDQSGVRTAFNRNRDDRQEFLNRANIRMVKPIDPHGNFVMLDAQHPAAEVIEHFRKHNILIGPQFPFMDTYVRISFGTPPEMSAFWDAWDLRPWKTKMEM